MIKLKFIAYFIVAALLAAGIASYFEESYRQLLRYFIKLQENDNVKFVGKNFHLFPSYKFVIGFVVFVCIHFWACMAMSNKQRVKIVMNSLLSFLISTYILSNFVVPAAKSQCVECETTSGFRIPYNEVAYDWYFLASLILGLVSLSVMVVRENKKKLIEQRENRTTKY